jgi:hypothetical protein
MDKDHFLRLVVNTMQANPSWVPEVFDACQAGSRLAIQELNKRRQEADMACLAALSLCDTKRLSQEAKDGLLQVIATYITPPNLCEIEKKFAGMALAQREKRGGQ